MLLTLYRFFLNIFFAGLEAWRTALAAHAQAEGRQPTIESSAENSIFQSLADVPGNFICYCSYFITIVFPSAILGIQLLTY